MKTVVSLNELTSAQLAVLESRYLRKDKDGNVIETIEEMFHRVADFISTNKDEAADFYKAMTSFSFMPSSPVLMNSGVTNSKLNLIACFVLPVMDSLIGEGSIMDTLQTAASIFKEGGGVGYNFGNLRPEGAAIGNKKITGFSSGPLSFMDLYDKLVDVVKAGGGRRGAQMGVLHVTHPDIEKFVDSKLVAGKFTNFNISVGVTDEFMKCAAAKSMFMAKHSVGDTVEVDADKLMDKICTNACNSAEPGILFLDNINKYNTVPHLGVIEATNPCGEIPLLNNEACCLGSINLNVINRGKKIDWKKLEKLVRLGVRFLNHVLDKSKYQNQRITDAVAKTRKIGLGVMGFADLLAKMGIGYNTEQGISTAKQIAEYMRYFALDESVSIAQEQGYFPAFKGSVYDHESDCYRTIEGESADLDYQVLNERIKEHGIRNANLLAVAPTGTIAMISGASYGVEPYMRLAYEKNVLDGKKILHEEPLFVAVLKDAGIYAEEYMQRLALSEKGSCQNDNVSDEIKTAFVTTYDITPEWHVRMQAAWQQFIDHSISKTVNMNKDATPRDVRDIYTFAHMSGCKGITVYVDGSRDNVIGPKVRRRTEPRERGKRYLKGKTGEFRVCAGTVYVGVNVDEFLEPFEIFINGSQNGGCNSGHVVSRLVSLLLQSDVSIARITKVLEKEECPKCLLDENVEYRSLGHVISQALKECLYDNVGLEIGDKRVKCSSCGSSYVVSSNEKCIACPQCGGGSCSTI